MVELEQERRPEVPEREFTRETASLVAAVGNSEAKAITLGMMQEGLIYSRGDLYREMMGLRNGREEWGISRTTPFAYCQDSLAPIGLVTRKVIDQHLNTWGYTITLHGEEVGKALVGHLLKWSLDHPNFSLYQMLGSTSSSSKPQEAQEEIGVYRRRAPGLRLKIFWELATNSSRATREVDVARELGEKPELINVHLWELERNGVIGYRSAQRGEHSSFYKLNGETQNRQPKTVDTHVALTQKVYQLLREQPTGYFSIGEATRMLRRRDPKHQEVKGLRTYISVVLAGLARQGFVECKKFSEEVRSELTISEEQREVITSLLEIIDRLQTKDEEFLEEGRRLTRVILADPEKVAELLRKAKESSPYANRLSQLETKSFIVSIVEGNPGFTASQIQNKIEQRYGKKLSGHSVRELLATLWQQRKIIARETKTGFVYILPEG